jgi:putative OPT family oligopeptide transporter
VREFTKSALILGTILSVLFGISNAYLALKAGMTVSASIPAAVGALALFSLFHKRGTILEANIVQTIASAGESFFILSINIHPYSLGLLVLMGGSLGIIAGMTFRKDLVEDESLPFPEGKACNTWCLSWGNNKVPSGFWNFGILVFFKLLWEGFIP